MKPRFYLWDGEKVIEANSLRPYYTNNHAFYAVNTTFSDDFPKFRYGLSDNRADWRGLKSVEALPKEFRVALLLLL